MATISLCMIVKNAGKNLRECLDSVKDIVDEIIIVDTGSRDNTKEIAKKFTDKVFDFRWTDSFADARNESIRHATKEWILFIDDDERISKKDHNRIKKLTEIKDVDGYYLLQRNYTFDSTKKGFLVSDDYEEALDYPGFFNIPIVRLFRNNKDYSFRYRIHEGVEWSIKENKGKLVLAKIPIHHYNFTAEKNYRKKVRKYVKLGELQIKDTPNDPKPYYEVGQVYRYLKQWADALKYFRKVARLDENFENVFFELGLCYVGIGDMNKAIASYKKSYELKKDASSAINLANIYYKTDKTDKAIDLLATIIEKDERNVLAIKNLAVILNKTGERKKAINILMYGLVKNPGNQILIKELKKIND